MRAGAYSKKWASNLFACVCRTGWCGVVLLLCAVAHTDTVSAVFSLMSTVVMDYIFIYVICYPQSTWAHGEDEDGDTHAVLPPSPIYGDRIRDEK